jgi:hypothetical protein
MPAMGAGESLSVIEQIRDRDGQLESWRELPCTVRSISAVQPFADMPN